jgi:hypothetical protein
MSVKRILVLGGGFVGLWSAVGAARKPDELGCGRFLAQARTTRPFRVILAGHQPSVGSDVGEFASQQGVQGVTEPRQQRTGGVRRGGRLAIAKPQSKTAQPGQDSPAPAFRVLLAESAAGSVLEATGHNIGFAQRVKIDLVLGRAYERCCTDPPGQALPNGRAAPILPMTRRRPTGR